MPDTKYREFYVTLKIMVPDTGHVAMPFDWDWNNMLNPKNQPPEHRTPIIMSYCTEGKH